LFDNFLILLIESKLRVVIPVDIFSSMIFSQSIRLKSFINAFFSLAFIFLSQKSLLNNKTQFSKSIFSASSKSFDIFLSKLSISLFLFFDALA